MAMGRHWWAYWHSVANRVTNGMFAIGKPHLVVVSRVLNQDPGAMLHEWVGSRSCAWITQIEGERNDQSLRVPCSITGGGGVGSNVARSYQRLDSVRTTAQAPPVFPLELSTGGNEASMAC